MFKIVLVKQDYQTEDDEPTLSVSHPELSQLLADPDVQQELKLLGWVNVKEVKEIDEKLILNKKFYTVSNDRVYGMVKQLADIRNMQGYEIAALATGGVLLQEVSLKSALSDEQWAQYRQIKDRDEERKKKERLTQEQRKEKRRQKDIEKAKKVLENHGLKVTNESDRSQSSDS